MNQFIATFKRGYKSIATIVTLMALMLSLLTGFAVPTAVIEEYSEDVSVTSISTAGTLVYSNLSLTPGANETEMGISWHTATSVTGTQLGISERGNPDSYQVFSALTRGNGANVTSFTSFRYNIHQVTVSGLKPSTTYDYVIIQGTETSGILSFTTGNPNNFTFLAMGDIQIGADGSANNRAWQAQNWITALDIITRNFPYASFIASAGDQIETNYSSATTTSVTNAQTEYNLLLSAERLSGLPIAPSVGNHDVNPLFRDHYNIPSTNIGAHGTGATQFDYWFRYGNTLIIVLDSNTTSAASAISRRPFFENAIKQNEDAAWKVVMFHHPPYSAYRLESDSSKAGMRNNWVPIFEANGIDVVLNGHCHSYNRTYQMLGDVPQKDQIWIDSDGSFQSDTTGRLYTSVLNPTGIVYFTLNATAGAKFYMTNTSSGAGSGNPRYHSAVFNQRQLPNFTVVDVTDSSFTVTTYQIDGTPATAGTASSTPNNRTRIHDDNGISLVDTYTIYKGVEVLFDTNGADSDDIAAVTLILGETVEEPEAPVKEGYIFKGWQLNGDIFDFNTPVVADITLTALWEEIVLVSATPSARVQQLNGNQNHLYITITELYSDGNVVMIEWDGRINNNAEGTYTVGDNYYVFVNTKGNTQIRACYIVDMLTA